METTGRERLGDGPETTQVIELAGGEVLDPAQALVRYDRDSDTLMVHFYGAGVPGVSVATGSGWYVRWDRERTRPIGIQIEGFLARAVREDPCLVAALDLADLRGITREDVAGIRQQIAPADHGENGTGAAELLALLWRKVADGGERASRRRIA